MVPVSQGHEVSRQRNASHDRYAHQILSEIEAGKPISQRSLANNLGIALGMTNLLLRRLVRKGLIRVSQVRPNRLGYFLTPTGIAEKSRMSRMYFQDSVRLYASARDRLRANFADLSREWPVENGQLEAPKRLFFLGSGEVAEIAYVCLQETDLELAGVFDFQGRQRFFGAPVYSAAATSAEEAASIVHGGAVLVAFGDSEPVRTFLDRTGLPIDRVFWM
jgi:DNA-binding MarR family transcriptional regulator